MLKAEVRTLWARNTLSFKVHDMHMFRWRLKEDMKLKSIIYNIALLINLNCDKNIVAAQWESCVRDF